MDSKSISREGVGVQVPASAPQLAASDAARERLGRDPYLVAALPALVHRVNNATQILTGLNALLSLGGGEELFETRRGDLESVAEMYERSGWLLAVFGSALGAATVNQRRERDGLVAVLDLARELARREGREFECAGRVPRLAPSAGEGWESAWALGSWIHAGVRGAQRGARIRGRFQCGTERWTFEDDARATEERAALASKLRAWVRGIWPDVETGRLEFSPEWFERGAP